MDDLVAGLASAPRGAPEAWAALAAAAGLGAADRAGVGWPGIDWAVIDWAVIDWAGIDWPGVDWAALVHVAALCQLAGFLMRDQMKLRALLLAGGLLYIAYYLIAPAAPLWEAAFWSGLMAAVNLGMMVVIARGRRPLALTDDALRLRAAFAALEPGDFRLLMGLATVEAAAAPLGLTERGARAGRLFHVTEGEVEIALEDGVIRRAAPLFIGELGYLLDRPANATVALLPGGRALAWDSERLRALAARRPAVAQALERALSRDLAAKVLRGSRDAEPGPR